MARMNVFICSPFISLWLRRRMQQSMLKRTWFKWFVRIRPRCVETLYLLFSTFVASWVSRVTNDDALEEFRE